MMAMMVRRCIQLVLGLAMWLGAAACASRPDIRGDNDEAREWAEKQQRQEAEQEQRGTLPAYRRPPPPAPVPAAKPVPQPAPAPPVIEQRAP
jgi:hypothetical protein